MTNFFKYEKSKEWLKDILRNEGAEIVFIKTDGTERKMHCTLNESEIPAEFAPKGTTRAKSDETCAVFDLEANGWRSFRWDSVKSVNFTLGEE